MLAALQDKLLNQELFEEFCDEFTREMNRLRMQHRADLTAAEREIERIEERRKKLVKSIMDGVPASEVRDELKANALRREALQAKVAAADEPPLLHPGMAELSREKVTDLAKPLKHPDTRTEAAEAIRGLIDAIDLTPAEGALEAHVVRRGRPARGPAEAGHYDGTADSGLQIWERCWGGPKCEEVARNRRPLAASSIGCGGG